jgi:hypothetical protein
VRARRKASLCSASAYLTRAAQPISPSRLRMPHEHPIRESVGPACLIVTLPSCQRVASTGSSVESAHALDGHSILITGSLCAGGAC